MFYRAALSLGNSLSASLPLSAHAGPYTIRFVTGVPMNLLRYRSLPFHLFVIWLSAGQCLSQVVPEAATSAASFIENRGQWPSEVRYLSRLNGMEAWITDGGIVYDFYRIHPRSAEHPRPTDLFSYAQDPFDPTAAPELPERSGHVVRMEFAGANGEAVPDDGTRRSTYHNYFIGKDRTKWAANVPLYGGVRLKELYPGIDAVLRFDGGSLRYDLHVAAGVDPAAIRLRFAGADDVGVNANGELTLGTSVGDVVHGSLFAYQEIGGTRRRVECAFRKEADGDIGFALGAYDRRHALVIDPLIYSTFLAPKDDGFSVAGRPAVDDEGYAYVPGYAHSESFPTTPGAYDRVNVNIDIFVLKLNPGGTDVIFSTFVGGIGADYGIGIAVDKERNLYVVGNNSSGTNDFPTTPGAFDTAGGGTGTGGFNDAVVFKLNPTGTALIYSTFLAGDRGEGVITIAIDNDGNAYIAGNTLSSDYPVTPGAFRTAVNDTISPTPINGFVTKLNADGSALVYSTYLGGTNGDIIYDMALNARGEVFVTGYTYSGDFPITSGTIDPASHNVYVARLNAAGTGLVYSMGIASAGGGWGEAIALDSAGNAYVAGTTIFPGFPTTPNAFERQLKGLGDGYVLKLNAAGTGLVYSTFLGSTDTIAGPLIEGMRGIEVDRAGNAVVSGSILAGDFPVTRHPRAIDSVYDDRPDVDGADPNMVVAHLNADGSALLYATFLGPPGTWGGHMALDSAGYVYITGVSTGPGFPLTPGAYDTMRVTGGRAFISKLRITCMMKADTGDDTIICAGSSVRLRTDVVDGDGPFTYAWEPSFWVDDPTSPTPIAEPKVTSNFIVTVIDDEGCLARDTIRVRVLDPLVIDAGPDATICPGDSLPVGDQAIGGEGPYTYRWEPALGLSRADTLRPKASPPETTTYRVTVTDGRGCVAVDSITIAVRAKPEPVVTAGGPTTLCDGDSVTLDAGAGYAAYQWTNGERTRTIRVGASGAYGVEVTDANGCRGVSETIDVRVHTLPDVRIAGPRVVCSDGTSIYQVAPGANTTYEWRLTSAAGSIASGQGSNSITIQWGAPETATIELVARDDLTGCADSMEYRVTIGSELKPVIAGSTVLCSGGSAELDAGDGYAEYAWSTGETTRTITVDRTITVTVTVRDAGGCEGTSDPFTVTEKSPPDVRLRPGGEIRLCEGGEQEIAAPAGFAGYMWSTGETGESIRVNTEGTYWVEVTDADGCTGRSDTARVVRIEEEVAIEPAGDLSLCDGDSLTLSAPPGYESYAWSTGETTASIVVRTAGSYRVTVTAAGGCEITSDAANVSVVPLPAKPAIARNGDTLISDVADGYQWRRDGTDIPGATQRRYVIGQPGTYSVRVTNAAGCFAESDGVQGLTRYVAWLDTVEGNAGDVVWLRMRIAPALTASEQVTGYRAWIRVVPEALYPHDASSGSGAVAGDNMTLTNDGFGAVDVKRPAGGPAIEGETLFRLALRGLVTGSPRNEVRIDSVEIGGVGRVPVAGPGLAILHGCELGRGFGKGAEIVSITPNPASEEIEVTYRAPAGMRMRLRLVDMAGRELTERVLDGSTGEPTTVRLKVGGLDAGAYMVELREGEEVVVSPLIIKR